jgi:hypothetical protein
MSSMFLYAEYDGRRGRAMLDEWSAWRNVALGPNLENPQFPVRLIEQ